mmetsp:Transcript_9659/g.17564  ORF Transcript_9659/g.17564 Transcript_9659/m.17564 type:complete len:241 (-) Transcript_9659:46-768(-)
MRQSGLVLEAASCSGKAGGSQQHRCYSGAGSERSRHRGPVRVEADESRRCFLLPRLLDAMPLVPVEGLVEVVAAQAVFIGLRDGGGDGKFCVCHQPPEVPVHSLTPLNPRSQVVHAAKVCWIVVLVGFRFAQDARGQHHLARLAPPLVRAEVGSCDQPLLMPPAAQEVLDLSHLGVGAEGRAALGRARPGAQGAALQRTSLAHLWACEAGCGHGFCKVTLHGHLSQLQPQGHLRKGEEVT